MASIDKLRIEEPDPKPNGGRWRLRAGIIAAVVVLAAVGFLAASLLSGSNEVPAEQAAPVTPAPRPETPPAAANNGGFTAGGYLEVIPPGPSVVAARVEGPVITVAVLEGQRVETGELLVRLDDTLHRQELAEAEAAARLAETKLHLARSGFRAEEIDEATAVLRRAEARWQQARVDVQRTERQVAIGGLPERALEAARAEMEALAADVSEARALVALRQAGTRPEAVSVAEAEHAAALARLERARWRVEACEIRAPHAGVVMERFVQPGQWVAPMREHGTAHGSALMTIADPRHLQGWVEVNQRDAGRVFEGQSVSLASEALRGQTVRGEVARIMPMANLQRNTIHLKIAIPDPPEGLRPEMSVQVTFETAPRQAGASGEETSSGDATDEH